MKQLRALTIRVVILLAVCQTAIAQPSLEKWQKSSSTPGLNRPAVLYNLKLQQPTQASVSFAQGGLTKAASANWLASQLQLRTGVDALLPKLTTTLQKGMEVEKLQQYFKGIKVEHGIVNASSKAGIVTSMQMEFYTIADNLKTTPTISEATALSNAMVAVNAKKFIWEGYTGSEPAFQKPTAEIVIVADMGKNAEPCLAYKVEMNAIEPVRRAYVYVNAADGKVVLVDNLIKQENGQALTLYSGVQNITTTRDSRVDPTKPYILREVRNGQEITTLNYNRQADNRLNDLSATDFTDDDNLWVEQGNANKDDAALDAHFNMEVISDYWLSMHGRNGWDNSNGPIKSYVHVNDKSGAKWNNAHWNGTAMYFGDGGGSNNSPPQTSIDDCGHELGHAISQATAALVYRWESGALDEGFSDIWAACITNYLLTQFPSAGANKKIWRLFEESSDPTLPEPGLRDMGNPHLFQQPDTYKDPTTYLSNGVNKPMWEPASYEVCPDPDVAGLDHCGVHTNSGVLNKWFFLITNGGAGTNGHGKAYNVAGMDFEKSEQIAYQTELNLTPNAGYSVCRDVSVNAAAALYGNGSAEVAIVREAWLAVGVDSLVFNQTNTPIFATSAFTAIAVGKGGSIWAGTANNGLYKYNGSVWEKAPDGMIGVYNNSIRQIMAGEDSSIWIAQSGRTGAQALQGGAVVFPKEYSFDNYSYYGTSAGLPSLNATSIFLDTFPSYNPLIKRVWVATMGYIKDGAAKSGGIGNGVLAGSFTKITAGLKVADGTGGCQTIGGNRDKTWIFSNANGSGGQSQILEYSASTGFNTGAFDSTNTPNADPSITNAVLPKNFTAKSIYFDYKGNAWLGLLNNGLAVYDGSKWRTVSFPSIFPAGTIVNNNAITGDKLGNVYIGTNSGLVVFTGSRYEKDPNNAGFLMLVNNPIDKESSYKRYTTVHGLPSNNIRAIAIDFKRNKLPIATDNGIVFWDQVCLNDCYPTAAKSISATLGSGSWSDPGIWMDNKVPDEKTAVVINHAIVVDIDAKCFSLEVRPGGGSLHINAGLKLNIAGKAVPVVPQD